MNCSLRLQVSFLNYVTDIVFWASSTGIIWLIFQILQKWILPVGLDPQTDGTLLVFLLDFYIYQFFACLYSNCMEYLRDGEVKLKLVEFVNGVSERPAEFKVFILRCLIDTARLNLIMIIMYLYVYHIIHLNWYELKHIDSIYEGVIIGDVLGSAYLYYINYDKYSSGIPITLGLFDAI